MARQRSYVRSLVLPGFVALLCAGSATPAWAHVKWFSKFSFGDPPRGLSEVITPTFLALALLSVVVVTALVPVDAWLQQRPWVRRINQSLAARSDRSRLVMRVGTGVVLLLAWQTDVVLVPDLHTPAPWVGWFEFGLAALLLFEATTALAGAGLFLLFSLGAREVGLYYMLDYLLVLGVGYYLIASGMRDRRVAASALPALYATVGFSLCWAALEKVVWPDWALSVLNEHQQLALGLDPRFFLLAAAFIEFSLGYLLIINLLQRPLALIITLTFFTTTTVFGKTEVLGHTLIHAALIVFLLEGPGQGFRPPIALPRTLGRRSIFAAVNLVLLLGLLLPLYSTGAAAMHRAALGQRHGATVAARSR
jgi:hypothetical protein